MADTGMNFHLDDKTLADKKMELKIKNHGYSEKSKFGNSNEPHPPENLDVGDFIFLKEDKNKHKLKDLYLVTKISEENVTIIKVLHYEDNSKKTKFGNKKFTVPSSSVFKADNHSRSDSWKSYDIPDIEENIINEKRPVSWTVFPQTKIVTSSESSLEEESPTGENPVTSTATNEVLVEDQGEASVFNEHPRCDPNCEPHNGVLNVPMYEDHQMPFIDNQLVQWPLPRKGDTIFFYHGDYLKWVKATLTSNELRGYKKYFNIKYEDGSKDGVYLRPNERWTLWGKENSLLNRVITQRT